MKNNNTVIGCSTMVFEKNKQIVDFEDIFLIKSIGIKYLELSDTFELDKSLAEHISKNNMKIFSIHSDYMNSDISDLSLTLRTKGIDAAKRRLELLKHFDGQLIVVHPGGWFSHKKEKQQRIKNCIKSLCSIVKAASAYKITVAIENLPTDFFGDNIDDIKFILDNVRMATGLEKSIGICLDTGHAFLTNTLDEYINYFKNDILTIHLQDNNGDNYKNRALALDDIHCPPNCGKINWNSFFYKLENINYNGAFIFEIKSDFMPNRDRRYCIEKIDEFIRANTMLLKNL